MQMMGEASFRAPFAYLAGLDGAGALAVLVETEGPAYRTAGSTMAIGPDGTRVGSLSSGCIEADIVTQSSAARLAGKPRLLRYGRGSPFVDLRLPCGGGMSVVVLPDPDPGPLRDVLARTAARRDAALIIDPVHGKISCGGDADDHALTLICPPEIRAIVLGTGAEARFFTSLADAAGFDVELLSPEEHTLATAKATGVTTRQLQTPDTWQPGTLDPWTAVVLFFHDHGWEPVLLTQALAGHAFYVGAQGSKRALESRLVAMRAAGVPEAKLGRLRSPIGVTPSARDPRALAISVLADICAAAPALQTLRAPSVVAGVAE